MVHIWKPHNYLMPLLIVPYKDANGLIQSCQIRLHANDILSDKKRYFWLSSPLERHGTSSGTPIHFTFVKEKLPPGETVLITEGALKADTVVRFRPNARVIATSGVTCSHNELVTAARPYNALIAFDSDHRINPAVCRQLARLIVMREQDSREHEYLPQRRLFSGMNQKELMMPYEKIQASEFLRSPNGTRLLEMNLPTK